MRYSRFRLPLFITLLTFLTSQIIYIVPSAVASPLILKLSVNKSSFYIRETVRINGSVTYYSSPVSGGLVAIQVRAPYGNLAFRTLATGDITNPNWPIEVQKAELFDDQLRKTNNFTIGTPSSY